MEGLVEDLAEEIVKQARALPTTTRIALTSNNARIAKVAVTGGVGLQITYDGNKKVLFPMQEAKNAVESFMASAHESGTDIRTKYTLKVFYENGVPALTPFDWNCHEARAKAKRSIHRILKNPPLALHSEMEMETASIQVDARERDGWNVESMPSAESTSTDESEVED